MALLLYLKINSTIKTQQFIDNVSYQMHFNNNSFPEEIARNIIWNGADTNALIYNDAYPPSGTLFDVEYNCWDSHFNASNDLIPSGQYDWDPIWCPPTFKSTTSGTTLSDDELLYSSAMEHIENGDYVTAESELKEIITDYPTTETAKNSVKQLFELENVLGADYLALKNYYANEANLQNNDQLGKLANWMISYCNVELGEYQLAIDYYDNVIDTTTSESDSTFAAIDMGEAALAAGNGNKNAASCKHAQFIFDTRKAFELNREYLINELLKSQKVENENDAIAQDGLEDYKPALLYQNVPNPFSDNTIIKVELFENANIVLEVFDFRGKKLLTLAKAKYEPGIYSFYIESRLLSKGMNYYSLRLNGAIIDSKKMIITK